jgi:hypothetical protein
MGAGGSSWTCPQCQRRVPGREPFCHCGFARTSAAAAGRSVAARPGSPRPVQPWAVLVMALVAGLLGMVAYVAVRPRDPSLAADTPVLRPRLRGAVGYPALPPVAAVMVRHARRRGTAASAPAPSVAKVPVAAVPASRPALTSAQQEWARAMGLFDLPLRKIAADTSVLELSYRPFAEACVDSASFGRPPARPTDWLASLKTVALRSGVTVREKGATVDCATARQSLVTQANGLKSELDAAEKAAHTSGVLPGHWRKLLATHDLEVWDRY